MGKHRSLDKKEQKQNEIRQLAVTTDFSRAEIADMVGASKSMVTKSLKTIEKQSEAVRWFSTHKADLLSKLECGVVEVMLQVVEKLADKNLLDMIPEKDLPVVLMNLSRTFASIHEKNRLEQGKSTVNVDVADLDASGKDVFQRFRDAVGGHCVDVAIEADTVDAIEGLEGLEDP